MRWLWLCLVLFASFSLPTEGLEPTTAAVVAHAACKMGVRALESCGAGPWSAGGSSRLRYPDDPGEVVQKAAARHVFYRRSHSMRPPLILIMRHCRASVRRAMSRTNILMLLASLSMENENGGIGAMLLNDVLQALVEDAMARGL